MKTKAKSLSSRVAGYLRKHNLTRLWRKQVADIENREEFIRQICRDLQLPYKSEKALFDALCRNYQGELVLKIRLGSRCFWLPEAWKKEQMWCKVEAEGARAWRANKRNQDNPYTSGSWEHQAWTNGFGDASDKAFLRVVKSNPSLLQGS